MIFRCKDDGTKLAHFALNNKYWCPKCKLFRTRLEVALIKGGLDAKHRVADVPGILADRRSDGAVREREAAPAVADQGDSPFVA